MVAAGILLAGAITVAGVSLATETGRPAVNVGEEHPAPVALVAPGASSEPSRFAVFSPPPSGAPAATPAGAAAPADSPAPPAPSPSSPPAPPPPPPGRHRH